ncbi:MAG: alpha/beta fold hydrolase [Agromyces sp.]
MPGTFTYPDRLGALSPVRHEALIGASRTAWWDYPARSASASTDLVIAVHGFRGDHHGLELFAAFWPEQRLIIPDLPGFGESAAFAGNAQSIEAYANWLSAFVEHVRPSEGRVFVLGHSFGSIIVSAALAAGLSVSAAILVNPISAPALEGPRALLTQLALTYYRIGAALPNTIGHRWLAHPALVRVMSATMAKTPDRVLRAFIHDQHDRYFSSFSSREAVLDAFRTSVSHTVADFLPSVTMPVLLIAAERDDITPLAAQHALAERVPAAELRVIPGVGHLVHYETPAVAVEHMRAFLDRV